MTQPLTPEEAAEALRQVEFSRKTFRSAIGAYHGHQHLWLWGCIWIAECALWQFRVPHAAAWTNTFSALGMVGSFWLGRLQNRTVRSPLDRRFLAALGAVIGFGLFVWPLVIGGPRRAESWAAYSALVAMQCYILAGIWFDSHLLAVGIIISVFILVGLLVFPAIFWIWLAVFGGGTLIASGFYVRRNWR